MKIIRKSEKAVGQLLQDVQAAVKNHKFGVLNIHDLKQKLEEKGEHLAHHCWVLDVCNPVQAAKVLSEDISLSIALPCRISVYEEGGVAKAATAKPTLLLAAISDSPELRDIAAEVEQTLIAIIEEAV